MQSGMCFHLKVFKIASSGVVLFLGSFRARRIWHLPYNVWCSFPLEFREVNIIIQSTDLLTTWISLLFRGLLSLEILLWRMSWHLGLTLFCLTKHVSESKLTHPISIGYLTVSFTNLTARLKDIIILVCCSSLSTICSWIILHSTLLALLKLTQITFCEHKVLLVWIVLHRSPKYHGTLLELHDVWSFYKATLELKFIKEIVPKIMFCKYSSISKDHQTIFSPCKSDIESSWIIQESNTWCFVASNTR